MHGGADLKLSSSQRQIEIELDASGVHVGRNTFDLPPALQTFTGQLDVHATFESNAATARQLLRLDVKADEPSLEGNQGTQLSAKTVALPKVQIDLARHQVDLGDIELKSPLLGITLTEAGVILPFAFERLGAGDARGGSWVLRSGAVEMRDGGFRATRADTSVELAIPSARVGGTRRHAWGVDDGGSMDGGTIAVDGMLGVQPLAATLDVQLDKLALPSLAELSASLPLELAKGRGGGTFHVLYADGGWRLDGEARIDGLQTAPPRADRTAEVIAVHSARAKFSLHPGASPGLTLRRCSSAIRTSWWNVRTKASFRTASSPPRARLGKRHPTTIARASRCACVVSRSTRER